MKILNPKTGKPCNSKIFSTPPPPRKCLLLLIVSLFYFSNANSQITLQLTPSNYNGFNVSCFGGSNGAIDLTISGGTPPYTVSWSNSATTEDISGLPAGYYRVTVDDADTLTAPEMAEITLIEPRKLTLSVNAFKYPNGFNISLYESCNGAITTTVADGVSPYSYLWNDGNTAPNRTSLCAANYTIAVTDANGCIDKNLNVLLIQPDRSDWQMSGNTGINDSTNFIGTIDGHDLVFKSNNIERARLKANGDFQINRILTNRIVSPDSAVYMGDNTLVFYTNHHSIWGNPNNLTPPNNNTSIPHQGTGLGWKTQPQGTWSISLGNDVITRDINGFAFGHKLRTELGATNAMIIGTGLVTAAFGSGNFINDIDNSIMIGMNGTKPTLFVAPGNGTGGWANTGAVGINTTFIPADYKLAVNGKIIATEVLVKAPGSNFTNWPPDYVFYEDYSLMSLPELKIFIDENCHLPDVPSATQLAEEGIKVYEMQLVLLKKVEELTLHAIHQQEEIAVLKQQIRELTSIK